MYILRKASYIDSYYEVSCYSYWACTGFLYWIATGLDIGLNKNYTSFIYLLPQVVAFIYELLDIL